MAMMFVFLSYVGGTMTKSDNSAGVTVTGIRKFDTASPAGPCEISL